MSVQTAAAVKRALKVYAFPARAKTNAWFFKTGSGEYGEGDEFIGVSMPDLRTVAKRCKNLPYKEISILLKSPVHEYRLAGVVILVYQYEQSVEKDMSSVHKKRKDSVLYTDERQQNARFNKSTHVQKKIVQFYIRHIDCVNNWDLVDVSAPQTLGTHYREYGGAQKLYTFAKSKSLWKRRIAIVATHAFIQKEQFEHTVAIAETLLHDKEDLIHKATGWMLREVGKRDKNVLDSFLKKHAWHMPRTMLRYAIEKYPEKERKQILISTKKK